MAERNRPNEIQLNLVYLTEHLTNMHTILTHLMQEDIISNDESQEIDFEKTDSRKAGKLLSILQRKGWINIKSIFLNILKKTNNLHCAALIERTSILLSNILNGQKWWPEEKNLPVAFYKRKYDDRLLVEKLKEMLSNEKSEGMMVITQNVTVSGLGGVGKTSTAIWYAQHYKEEYIHILWIDCGEKSLSKSFENLGRALKVENRCEPDLKQLAAGCYQILRHFKCLLIFDNAECFIRNIAVKEILPKSIPNFHVIITSRQKQWGSAKSDEEIPQLQLDVFKKNEGVEFLKQNIKDRLVKEVQFQMLCDHLGNLPLALQMSVATLNQNKSISFEEYSDRIKNSPEILLTKCKNYENTIDKAMNISMQFIQRYKSDVDETVGGLALKMLAVFGYITPDEVPLEFFVAVIKNSKKTDMNVAAHIINSYSLVTINSFSDDKYTLSIHRLLQQVMKHNSSRKREKKILYDILSCEGFLEYKLIPFTLSSVTLQSKFPVIKAELIDKLKLSQLLREAKFKEALALAKLIVDTLNDPVSKFNLAVCLERNNQITESEQILENLIESSDRVADLFSQKYTEWDILSNSTTPSIHIVMGHLFSIYRQEKNVDKARKSFLQCNQIPIPLLSMNELINLLQWISLPNIFVRLHEKEECITLNAEMEKEVTLRQITRVNDIFINSNTYVWRWANWRNNKLYMHNIQFVLQSVSIVNTIIMEHCTVDVSILPRLLKVLDLKNCILLKCNLSATHSPIHLKKISLINISVKEGKVQRRNHFDISCFNSTTLKKLVVKCFASNCECLRLFIPLKYLKDIKTIHLTECALEIEENVRLAPIKLTLNNVLIVNENRQIVPDAVVNDFVQLQYMRLLHLTGMSIDFKDCSHVSDLRLLNTKLLNWESGQWIIGKLSMFPSNVQTQMDIGHVENLTEPANEKNTSNMEARKCEVLTFLENNSGSKTITGLYSKHCLKDGIKKIRGITGVLPGMLTTRLPKYLAGVDVWQSFIEDVTSNWNSGYFVHIRWNYEGHPLYDILKDDDDTSWMDLIKAGGKNNELWKNTLDAITPFLHQLETAGVIPIFDLLIFINLNMKEYLWGGRGGLEGSLKLYQITRDYLTQHHGLNSLIWACSLSIHGEMTQLKDFWPGSSYVDVAAVYLGSRKKMTTSEYQKLLDVVGNKLISMEHMWFVPHTELLASQSRWAWFTVADDYLTNEKYTFNADENTHETFNSASVINWGSSKCIQL